jgi:serine/threonine protein kinase
VSPFLNVYNIFIDPYKLLNGFPFFNHVYVIMDYGYSDLRKYLQQKHLITFQEARIICKNINYAFFTLNSLGLLHRDLKPDNFLIDPSNLEIKIIDFGHSGFVKKSISFDDLTQRFIRYFL